MSAENSDRTGDTEERTMPRGRPFVRGMSGNPGGRPRTLREVTELARLRTPLALERLTVLMDSGNEAIALRACESLLDRGWGRPTQRLDLAEGPNVNLLVASPEWLAIRRALARALEAFPEARAAVAQALVEATSDAPPLRLGGGAGPVPPDATDGTRA